ncbi:cation:proton antiporter [Limosilactobacillus difficilis]|uniref:cation:proton antiporter n=1 Tax=Limosilactobacillus difficilis TaxID=2991838 RepID=UPI0024B993D2|nr:cation:proton antiporter [Limosilactobacillus difficilis]
MTVLLSLITVIMAAMFSSFIAAFIPKISINYVNIAVGITIALIAPLNHLVVPFSAEFFMYIVAPLIYFEGQATQVNLVRNSLVQIVSLCIILVVVSMVITGSLVAVLGIPTAIAFLVAAISTPTDATATETVSEGLKMPGEQKLPLKMESLFNDATSIILVGATAIWVESGNFHYRSAMLDFLKSAFGGVLIGIAIALIMITFRRLMEGNNVIAANAQVILFITTPFFTYLIAEEVHVSGILAVVCAGLMQNSESTNSRFLHPHHFYNWIAINNLVQEILNNMVFVILGIMFVRIIKIDIASKIVSWSWLIVAVSIYLVNLLIRFVYGKLSRMSNRGSLIFSIGGVRGAVTLALVFLIADHLTSQQFRQVVLVETIVIVLSMLMPSFIFPFILPHKISPKKAKRQLAVLRNEMVAEGLEVVEKIYLPKKVRERVLFDLQDQRTANSVGDFWQQWLRSNQHPQFNAQERELEQRALRWAFRAEREYLDMVSQRENMEEYVFRLYNDTLLAESILIDPDLS